MESKHDVFVQQTILPILEKNKINLMYHNNVNGTPMHGHTFLEISYITKGKVLHIRDGQSTVLEPGDFLIVDYGSMHSYSTIDNKKYSNLDCIFMPELLDPVLQGTESLSGVFEHYLLHFNMHALTHPPSRMIFHDDDGNILSFLKLMQTEYKNREAGYIEMLRSYLIAILLLTIRKLENASIASESQDIVAYITAYVSKHYMEPLTLRSIAANNNYCFSYLSKLFKDKMGVSFIAYLQNYRVMQSTRLLISTKKTISEISEMVGYSDVKFFSSLFKKTTGLTPTAFRKQHID